MANPTSLVALLLILLTLLNHTLAQEPLQFSITDAFEWSTGEFGDGGLRVGLEQEAEEEAEGMESWEAERRSLFWRAARYYISYGALSANRVPCPARSGRSYYTHNCYKARGPARPYVRGCSAISRCRR